MKNPMEQYTASPMSISDELEITRKDFAYFFKVKLDNITYIFRMIVKS